ncbi:MAG: hypothetical protein WCL07_04315 [bacterium]
MIWAWLLLATSWFAYSYGFVDFNLTLSNNPLIVKVIGWGQHLVFFDRPSSTLFYCLLLIITWGLYLVTIWKSKKWAYWKYGTLALLFGLAYPMLTHDIFNYLFHARIVVNYHANPHLLAPQVFVGDPWLRFMHWVHSPSAYGPVFTATMLVPYLVGMTKLTTSLLAYKLLACASYLLAIYLVGEIAKRNKLIDPNKARLLVALNPIILTEWLINAHNEVLMVTLMLLAWWMVGENKLWRGWSAIALSAGLKYAAILVAPALLLWKFVGERWALWIAVLSLVITPFVYHFDFQYQIWYITWAIPFAIITGNRKLIAAILGYSIGGMLIYAPYIATGFWNLTPMTKILYLVSPAALMLIVESLLSINTHRKIS